MQAPRTFVRGPSLRQPLQAQGTPTPVASQAPYPLDFMSTDSVCLGLKRCMNLLFNLRKQPTDLCAGTVRVRQHEQCKRVNFHHGGQLLDLAKCRIFDAALESAHVGSAGNIGEGFLREPAGSTKSA